MVSPVFASGPQHRKVPSSSEVRWPRWGEVKLEKPDGRVIRIPLSKLSEDDQSFIEEKEKADKKKEDHHQLGNSAVQLRDPQPELLVINLTP